jgi:hypothetical protein
MKKSLAFIFSLFTVIAIFSQNISDYEYVYVPKKFKNYKENEYNLNTLLKNALSQKNYKVVQEEPLNWPLELRNNPCSVLNAELLNTSSMFKNKVNLQFTDCKEKIVLESKASSDYKEFDLGYQDALKTSLIKVPASSPKTFDVKETIQPEEPRIIDKQVAQPVATTETVAKTESYTNGKISLQKVQISKDQFILVSSSSSVPFATFKNTTKSDVYRVTLENGTSTLGYTENGNLVIEIPTNDGGFKKEVFTAK